MGIGTPGGVRDDLPEGFESAMRMALNQSTIYEGQTVLNLIEFIAGQVDEPYALVTTTDGEIKLRIQVDSELISPLILKSDEPTSIQQVFVEIYNKIRESFTTGGPKVNKDAGYIDFTLALK